MPKIQCRSCGGSLKLIYDFGLQPDVNKLLKSQTETSHMQSLRFAHCLSCNLAQLEQTPEKFLFTQDYPYNSSINTPYTAQCRQWAETLNLPFHASIMEIASNDGYLLKILKEQGYSNLLGVEPIQTLAEKSQKYAPTLPSPFTQNLITAHPHLHHAFDLIIANNVLAHVDSPLEFLNAAKKCLKATGTISIEVQNAQPIPTALPFDTIYHEHQIYYTPETLQDLALRAGLEVIKIENIASHGGSIRARLRSGQQFNPDIVIRKNQWTNYPQQIQKEIFLMKQFVNQVKLNSKTIACFGAAAKGISALNYAGLSHNEIEYIIDETPEKQNKYTPLSKIPIKSLSHLQSHPTDYIWILPWNYQTQITLKIAPLTKAKIVTKGQLYA